MDYFFLVVMGQKLIILTWKKGLLPPIPLSGRFLRNHYHSVPTSLSSTSDAKLEDRLASQQFTGTYLGAFTNQVHFLILLSCLVCGQLSTVTLHWVILLPRNILNILPQNETVL